MTPTRRSSPATRATGRPTYQWLLFDADDTLFDYVAAEAAALRATFLDHGLPYDPATLATYQRVNRAAWREFEEGRITQVMLRTQRFEHLFADLRVTTDIGAFARAYLEHLGRQAQLVDGALEVVRALARTHQLAIITNGLADVQRPRLAASAIRAHVAALVISEEVGAAKPDRAIFDAAFARMGMPSPSEVLMIGDSLSSDIAGGIGYGLDTCWVNPRGLPGRADLAPTYEVRHVTELPALLAG
jgi:2-haloacid dehalogenase